MTVASLERQLLDRETVCDGLRRHLDAGADLSERESELARQVRKQLVPVARRVIRSFIDKALELYVECTLYPNNTTVGIFLPALIHIRARFSIIVLGEFERLGQLQWTHTQHASSLHTEKGDSLPSVACPLTTV